MSLKDQHDLFEYLDHLWVPVTAIIATIVTGAKLWWSGKQEIKRRMAAVEVLAENNDSASRKMLIEMQEMRKSNDQQHSDIVDKMIALFNGKK